MALIKCCECGKEISDQAKSCVHCGASINNKNKNGKICPECGTFQEGNVCSNCGNPLKKEIDLKILYIALGIFLLLLFIFILSSKIFDNDDSYYYGNERDEYVPQIEVLADYINIRADKSIDSEVIGSVSKGDVYTFLSYDEESSYKWYEIATEGYVHGYIAGTDDYVKRLDLKTDKILAYVFLGDRDNDNYSIGLANFLNNIDSTYLSKIYFKKYYIYENYSNRELFEHYVNSFGITDSGTPFLVIQDNYMLGYSDDEKVNYINFFNSYLGIKEEQNHNNSGGYNSGSTNSGQIENNGGNLNNGQIENNQGAQTQAPSYNLTSISGIGESYKNEYANCRIDNFQASLEAGYDNKIKISYTTTITKLEKLNYRDYNGPCEFTISLYNSDNILIKSWHQMISVDLGETARNTDFNYIDADGSSYYIKLKSLK